MSGMKPGKVVYFRSAKLNTHRKTGDWAFKQGHGFGLLLGTVPLFGKEPSPVELLRLVGTIGFLSFDDVAEFVGEEQAEICVKKFEDKYYGKVVETNPVEGEAESEGTKELSISLPKLVGADGLPL